MNKMSHPWNYARRSRPNAAIKIAVVRDGQLIASYPDTEEVHNPAYFTRTAIPKDCAHPFQLWLRSADATWSADGLEVDIGTSRARPGFGIDRVCINGQDDVSAPEFAVRVFVKPEPSPDGIVRLPLQRHMIAAGAVFSLYVAL